jgi:hypothetical protein
VVNPDEDDRGLKPNEKAIVTEFALDDWIAQQYGYFLGFTPMHRPNGIPLEAFESWSKYKRLYQTQHNQKPISPRSRDILFP